MANAKIQVLLLIFKLYCYTNITVLKIFLFSFTTKEEAWIVTPQESVPVKQKPVQAASSSCQATTQTTAAPITLQKSELLFSITYCCTICLLVPTSSDKK